MKKIAITQSNYIPWKGYFDLIAKVDEFYLMDFVQYTRRDWRNRNLIKTPSGTLWLSVPITFSRKNPLAINCVAVSDNSWAERHWKSIALNYARSPHFELYKTQIEQCYRTLPTNLSQINEQFIRLICDFLGINTPIIRADGLSESTDKNGRLIDICHSACADIYVSGPAAKSYLDENGMEAAGIAVEWMDYSEYPSYPQLWGEFTHNVTILDLLFNCGRDTGKFMKYVEK